MQAKKKGEMTGKGSVLARLGGKRRLPLLIAGAVLGVLLLLLGSMGGDAEEEREEDMLSLRIAELDAYEIALEEEIAALCDAVRGVSHVRVFVSLEAGYAVQYTVNGDGDPVTVGSGSSEEALYGTLLPPRIAGVGIVCAGGDRAAVQQELVALVSAALGISSNRIYVTGT